MTPASLSDLAYDDGAPEVIDDLAALQLVNPTVKDYANFARNLPCLVQIAERAFFYANQNRRFFELAVATPSEVIAADVASVHANVLLHNAAVIAVAVIPALRPSDRHARRQVGHAFLERVDDDDSVVRKDVRTAFGLDEGDAANLSADALAFAAARARTIADHGLGQLHRLEHRAALRSFLSQPADLDALDRTIQRHQRAVENIAVALEAAELSPEDCQVLEAARAGATLQYWVAVARFALSHDHQDRGLSYLLHGPIAPTAQLYSAIEIADEIGRSSRKMIREHASQ
ncbi:hypothetical protein ARD30_20335 [Bosea thiooxidans]|uniref:Uncharacterized protein n=1 Tax=Bosea thiooxidans TaxID=53254 RepID=A0A0Q3KG94_9HYPH|nr:hypothetical protein ARD30_20335 [Bosea thiooxidans]